MLSLNRQCQIIEDIRLNREPTDYSVLRICLCFLSRPNKVGLKCPYVRLSTKSFFDFTKIWHVGGGR